MAKAEITKGLRRAPCRYIPDAAPEEASGNAYVHRPSLKPAAIDDQPPPMELPWPPRNFVGRMHDMSAPCSKGRTRYGVPMVLCDNEGECCASFAILGDRRDIDDHARPGLAIDSMKIALVLSVTAARRRWPPGSSFGPFQPCQPKFLVGSG